ncbi:MAG: hypothetical protein ACJ779_00090 [Chloroflexota bacterium]
MRMPEARERSLATGILLFSLAWAVVVGSNLFQVSSWIVGDIAYHRGVAYTMQGAAWQGEGPFVGLLTYYGGLYPMVLGGVAGALAQPFDRILSVASWGLALLWPLACWWTGRRIWPGRSLAAALFVLLAVTAAPFTNRVLVWVDSPLASAQGGFPVYPRDLALVCLVVAVGFTLSTSRRGRVLGVGIAVGAMILVHLQIALLAAWLLTVWACVRAVRERHPRPLIELAGAGLIALAASSWWWLPRLAATIQSRGLLLGGFPGAPPLRLGLGDAVMAFGVVAIYGFLGLAVLGARRPLPGRIAPFLVWIVAFLPLVLVDRLVDGSDLVSERRVWLLVSIPLMVIAAAALTKILGRLRPAIAVAVVALVVVAPSVPGTLATARLVRDAWEPGRAGGRVFDAAAWDPVFADLAARVRADGHHVAITYDADAPWVWSFSGAQVPSLWLPGPFKLGFDPERATGRSYLDRLRDQEAAFSGGRDAICRFTEAYGGGSIVLDVEDGMVGLRDVSPASRYRVDPRDRSEATIERDVGGGLTYVDRGGLDVLRMTRGATWQPPFRDPDARLLAVEILVPPPPPGAATTPTDEPLIEVDTGSGRTSFGDGLAPGWARVVVPVTGVGDAVTIRALADVDLVRATAFDPVDGLPLPAADGPVRLAPAALCPTS